MNKFITFLFAVIFSFWSIRLYYKLYDKKTRSYILVIGLLIIFWMVIRIFKGVAFDALTERLCWYLYYLPLIFIPTLYYICSSSLLNDLSIQRKKIIYIISFILLFLVLTNDFHEFVFKFDKGIILYDEYTHYIGYYLISIWIFYLFGKSMIKLALFRMKIRKDIKGFLPFVVIIIGLTYTALYVLNVPFVRSINMSIVNSALICIGIELAFYLDLIPNNRKYIETFLNSNLDMAILSFDGKTKYTTKKFKNIPDFILNDIKRNKLKENYSVQNITYDIKKNKDSYVVLKKDLTSINELKMETKMQKEELLKQQASLKIEEKTKKELYDVQIRKDVIKKVEKNLSKKRIEAKKLLMKDDVTKNDLEKVKRIIIYSKKKSMLLISNINGDIYDEDNIKVLLLELISSMQSAKVKGFVSIKDKLVVNGKVMNLLYDIVYELIENSINKSIMIFIFKDEMSVVLKAIIDTKSSLKDKIKLDSNILIDEKLYDTDLEIEFIIRNGVMK